MLHIARRIFDWDKNYRGWCKNIKDILLCIDNLDNFFVNRPIDLENAKRVLFYNECEMWKEEVNDVPKLRTYILYKHNYGTEPYALIQNRAHRSIMAQFRSGILPLSIETGRFSSIPTEFRLCIFCPENVIEDETHFMFKCSHYNELRHALYCLVEAKYLFFSQFVSTRYVFFANV